MTPEISVIKRNGKKEPLDLEKIHKVVEFACAGLAGTSPSEVELKSHLMFYNEIETANIQETLIKAAAELISEEAPNYQYVAGRLINYHLRKELYHDVEPPSLYDQIKHVTAAGFYSRDLITRYTPEELEKLDSYIDHDRDYTIPYVGMEQFRGKYLVKNRHTKRIFETPQFAYMLIAMTLFQDYGKDRLRWVKKFYDATSQGYISLPTPIMAGVRTPQKQYSSCVLIETADDLDSIFATAHAVGKYVSQKAGIGIGGGNLRGIGSKIRGGDATHTGVIPFFRMWQSAVKSCSQGGVRGGAATVYYPIWHIEAEDLLVLKNNKGTEFTRVRQLDYGVQFNKLMYERLISGGDITLFSQHDVPGLYDSFFVDQDKFRELYEAAEANPNIRKKTIKAVDLFSSFMQERKETGRIYLQNVDNANDHSSFISTVAAIRQSNLCAEITLPTKPIFDVNDDQGEIALCILAALNWGMMRSPDDFEEYARLAVRGLDALIDLQEYPIKAAEVATLGRRPIGVGINNFAFWMAKNGLKYDGIDQAGLEMIDEWAEAFAFYLTQASIELAEEKGGCPLSGQTKYGQGLMPNNTYKKDLDELIPHRERLDWQDLRKRALESGIRNSTTMAIMPSETSSTVIPGGSTNGIEPIRALISVKQSKDGVLATVAPGIQRYKKAYDLLWDQKSPEGYLKIVSVLQKYIDQGISVNTSYNPEHYGGTLDMATLLRHMLMFYKYGGKQLYYFNTHDQAGELDIKQPEAIIKSEPAGEDEDECSSCKL